MNYIYILGLILLIIIYILLDNKIEPMTKMAPTAISQTITLPLTLLQQQQNLAAAATAAATTAATAAATAAAAARAKRAVRDRQPRTTTAPTIQKCDVGYYCPGQKLKNLKNGVPSLGESQKKECPEYSYQDISGETGCKAQVGYEILNNNNQFVGVKPKADYERLTTFKDSNDKIYNLYKSDTTRKLVKEPDSFGRCTIGYMLVKNLKKEEKCLFQNNNAFIDPYSLFTGQIIYRGKISKCPSGYSPNDLRNQCVKNDWVNNKHPLRNIKCKKVSFSNSTGGDTGKFIDSIDISCNPGSFGGGKFNCRNGVITPDVHSPGNDSKDCQPCPVGTFQDLSGQYTCKKCIRGTHQDKKGQTDCKQCGIDTYQDISGSEICKNCGDNTYQDISGSTSCKPFCQYIPGYKQISGPDYTGKIPYGLYEKEISNGRNTFHICDKSGVFAVINDKNKLGSNYNYRCNEGNYKCPIGTEHLKKYANYDGTKNNFDLSCCSEFPTDVPFSYLNSASCKLTGTMDLESGHNKINDYYNFIDFYNDDINGPNQDSDLFSIENQQKWNKFKSI